MAKKTIRVTKEDIENGCKEDINNCPVAIAITRSFQGPSVTVDADEASFTYSNDRRAYRELPRKARAFIQLFDAGLPVKPFSFSLRWSPSTEIKMQW